MSANPHTNGGVILRDLRMPDFRDYAVDVPRPGTVLAEATRQQSGGQHEARQFSLGNPVNP